MTVNEYSDLKPAWHLDKVLALREGRRVVPAQVQLVISDLCNHDCPWCAYRMEGYPSNQNFVEIKQDGFVNHNPTRFIPTAKAIEILSDCKAIGVSAVQFTGGGEPTVHPEHMEIFKHALDLGLSCSLVTNGNILRKGWESVLSRFAWVRVSLDAGTSETYAKVRRTRPGQFTVALDFIRALSGTGGPVVSASYIVMRDNFKECESAAALAEAHGASSVRFAAFWSLDKNYYDGWLDDARSEVNKAKGVGIRVVDMLDERNIGMSDRPDYQLCGYQHFNVYVGGDQKVYRCCDTSYNDRGFVGDLSKQSFKQWWSSPESKAAYDSFDARGCSLCAFNGKNRVLSFLAGHPAHVEFA